MGLPILIEIMVIWHKINNRCNSVSGARTVLPNLSDQILPPQKDKMANVSLADTV